MRFKTSRGWFLIEAIVAVAIFAMLASVFVSLSAGSLNPWLDKKNETQAEVLANEGLEAVRSIQKRAWNEFVFHASAIEYQAGAWRLTGEGSQETIGRFTRQLFFEPVCREIGGQIADCPAMVVDPYIIKVKSVVNWQNYLGANKNITREVYLSAWRSHFWQQNDWSGGDGQLLWSDITRFDSQQNISATTTGQITLENASSTYSLSGYLISSAFDLGAPSKIQVVEWQADDSATTSVKLQIRAAPDNSGGPGAWSSWYGAGGPDTYFTSATGTLISQDLNDNQWLQYRAELSGDSSSTPALKGVKINYQ